MIILAMLIFYKQHGYAQCPFTATVNTTTPILCPNTSAVITTQTYDAYQWYRDGAVLPGETNPTLNVSYNTGAGSYYSVLATLNGCSEMSDSILIDGWVFLPPTVMSSGSYSYDPNSGFFIICDSTEADGGDSIVFELMSPYDTNITWYNNGVPIPGAAGNTLVVKTSGSYMVSGAPSLCPASISWLGVNLDVRLKAPDHPVISWNGTQLVATPSWLTNWQWYLNGTAIFGANSASFTPLQSGNYTVTAQDSFCYAISQQPYFYNPTGIPDRYTSSFKAYPNPAASKIIIDTESIVTMVELFDVGGRLLLTTHPNTKKPEISLRNLDPGSYRMRVTAAGYQEIVPVLIQR